MPGNSDHGDNICRPYAYAPTQAGPVAGLARPRYRAAPPLKPFLARLLSPSIEQVYLTKANDRIDVCRFFEERGSERGHFKSNNALEHGSVSVAVCVVCASSSWTSIFRCSPSTWVVVIAMV